MPECLLTTSLNAQAHHPVELKEIFKFSCITELPDVLRKYAEYLKAKADEIEAGGVDKTFFVDGGFVRRPKGPSTRPPRKPLTADEIRQIKIALAERYQQDSIAERFKISQSLVSMIKLGQRDHVIYDNKR